MIEYVNYDNVYSYDEINADLILHSNWEGEKLYTFLLTIPNIIHPELLRHRSFSFCVSSNRAIPSDKMVHQPLFIPKLWRTRGRGMQPKDVVNDPELANKADKLWTETSTKSIISVNELAKLGISKELANRLLAPFQLINILVGTTDRGLQHFLNLRDAPEAQFEIQVLARRMKEAISADKVQYLSWNDWHMPFLTEEDKNRPLHEQLMVSTARCARTSYKLPSTDKTSTFEDDLKLCKRLVDPTALHASPFEFCATPGVVVKRLGMKNMKHRAEGNYDNWFQLRYFLENQDDLNIIDHSYETLSLIRRDIFHEP